MELQSSSAYLLVDWEAWMVADMVTNCWTIVRSTADNGVTFSSFPNFAFNKENLPVNYKTSRGVQCDKFLLPSSLGVPPSSDYVMIRCVAIHFLLLVIYFWGGGHKTCVN